MDASISAAYNSLITVWFKIELGFIRLAVFNRWYEQ